jgi:hypothetical protein
LKLLEALIIRSSSSSGVVSSRGTVCEEIARKRDYVIARVPGHTHFLTSNWSSRNKPNKTIKPTRFAPSPDPRPVPLRSLPKSDFRFTFPWHCLPPARQIEGWAIVKGRLLRRASLRWKLRSAGTETGSPEAGNGTWPCDCACSLERRFALRMPKIVSAALQSTL